MKSCSNNCTPKPFSCFLRTATSPSLHPATTSVDKMTTGLSRCRECGLALTIEVEEPRCVCGYLLYNLAGTSCPECGREVTAGAEVGAAESGG